MARPLKKICGFPYKLQTNSREGGGGDEQNAQYKPLENEKQIKFEDQRKSKIRLMTGVFRAGLFLSQSCSG